MKANAFTINLAWVVDDDSTYTFSIEKILANSLVIKNYKIFNSGVDALAHFKAAVNTAEKIPDILFLDINMPMMDGWTFLDELIKIKSTLNKAITVYLFSSSINPVDIARAKTISAVAQYIVKPIDFEKLEKIFKYFDIKAV